MKRNDLRILCWILCVASVTMFSIPAVSAGINGYSRVVYNVSGLQNYSLHWNERFPPGSNLSIYVEAQGVNHKRILAVDYIFIIRDSNFNIVDTSVNKSRRRNYNDNDFIEFTRAINETWEDGFYTTQIHIFDLLNDSLADQYYANVTSTLVNQTNETDTLPDLPIMNRGFIINNSELEAVQHKVIIQRFWIDKYSDKYPVNRFSVENLLLESKSVAPNESVNVSLNIVNNFYDNGTVLLDILLDGQKLFNISEDVQAFSSKKINFNVSSDIVGNHSLEIVPVSKNTIGFDLLAYLDVKEQEIKIPTIFEYKDIKVDNISVAPNETEIITVTIENKGRPGSLPVSLLINDIPEIEQTVYLNFAEEKDVKFNVTKQELGEYRVTINNSGLSKVFFVNAKEEEKKVEKIEEKESKISKIYSILGIAFIIILMIITRIYIRKEIRKLKK